MNDYVRGAFEALNWVEALLADIEPAKDPHDQLKNVVTEGVVVVHRIFGNGTTTAATKREPEPYITVIPR